MLASLVNICANGDDNDNYGEGGGRYFFQHHVKRFHINRLVIILLFKFLQETYCFCHLFKFINSPASCICWSPASLLSIFLFTLATVWAA